MIKRYQALSQVFSQYFFAQRNWHKYMPRKFNPSQVTQVVHEKNIYHNVNARYIK